MKTQHSTSLPLTRDQFRSLAKAVYLGRWVANAHRTGSPEDPLLEEYDDIAEIVFSQAETFGFPKNFEYELEQPIGNYPSEIGALIEEYDDDTFWDELCERLGERDFFRSHTREDIDRMSQEEWFAKMDAHIDIYEKEAAERGVDRLEIMKTIKDFGVEL